MSIPKPVSDLVPKARLAAERFAEAPADTSAARVLSLMVNKLRAHEIPVDMYTHNRALEAARLLEIAS